MENKLFYFPNLDFEIYTNVFLDLLLDMFICTLLYGRSLSGSLIFCRYFVLRIEENIGENYVASSCKFIPVTNCNCVSLLILPNN